MVYNKLKQAIRKMMSAKHKSWKEIKANNIDYLHYVKGDYELGIDLSDKNYSLVRNGNLIKSHQYDTIFNLDEDDLDDNNKIIKLFPKHLDVAIMSFPKN